MIQGKDGSLYVSDKLPTYPSPKATLCSTCKWEVGVNVGLGEAAFQLILLSKGGGHVDHLRGHQAACKESHVR